MKIEFRNFEFSVSYPFAAVLALAMVFDKEGTIVCCVLAAALHEAAHIAVILAFGCPKIKLCLKLLDFKLSDCACCDRSDFKNLIIYLSGPAANIALYLLFGVTGLWQMFGEANLAMGIFNLIPLSSFDGGRALYIILRSVFSERVCNGILNIFAFAALAVMYFIAIEVLIYTGYNFSLLLVCVYLTLLLVFKGNQFESV